MSAEHVAGQGGQAANPEAGQPNPAEIAAKVGELEKTLETYKRQVAGSQEEAIRLKKETDELREELREAQQALATATSKGSNASFQERVREVGEHGAVKAIVDEQISELKATVKQLQDQDASRILEDFRKSHPALKDEMLVQFNTEFSKLKSLYSIGEAMEKAYILAGGTVAKAEDEAQKSREAEIAAAKQKAEDEKAKAVAEASASPNASVAPAAASQDAALQQRMKDLLFLAKQAEFEGRDATMLWAEIEQLKFSKAK